MVRTYLVVLAVSCVAVVSPSVVVDPKLFCECGIAGDYTCKELRYGSKEIAFTPGSASHECRRGYFEQSDFNFIPVNAFDQIFFPEELHLTSCNLTRLLSRNFKGNVYTTETIVLDHNRLETVPTSVFSNLTFLKELSIKYNKLKTLEPDCFLGLRNLRTLHLDGNNIENLPELIFGPLHSLTTISLSGNGIKHLPDRVFANNTGLEYVYLDKNSLKIMGGNPPATAGYTRTLFLNLPKAAHVHLSGNYFPYVSKTAFARLRNLQQLFLDETSLSYIERGSFDNLHELTVLSLAGNDLKSFDVKLLERIRLLYSLKLNGNRLSDLDYQLLPKATRVFSLTLSNNFWSCDVLPEMRSFLSGAGILTDLEQDVCLNETTAEASHTTDSILETTPAAAHSPIDHTTAIISVIIAALVVFPSILYLVYRWKNRRAVQT